MAGGLRRDPETGPGPRLRAFLHADLVPRDDSLALYGSATEEERDLFRHLISAGGVGPKVAIAALSGGRCGSCCGHRRRRRQRFQAVPGIGKRTAERIIVELREKIAGEIEGDPAAAAAAEGSPDEARSLARDGLLNLGYTPIEVERLLDKAPAATTPEEIVEGGAAPGRRGQGCVVMRFSR